MQSNIESEKLAVAKQKIHDELGALPETAIILGSGLGDFADALNKAKTIETAQIPGYPPSTVTGHKGRWVKGECGSKTILAIQGRIHGYEGHQHNILALPIHILADCGVKTLIITNAAGAVNRFYSQGDLMVIEDCINFTFSNPLWGINKEKYGPRFPDMCNPYDPRFIEKTLDISRELGIRMQKGVYLALQGPSYETAAEIRMFERIGADAVGMSTVPETITAVYRGMRVLGVSCITNMGTGMATTKLSHAEVTETGKRVKNDFIRLIGKVIHE